MTFGETDINPPRTQSDQVTYDFFSPGKLSATPQILLDFITLPSSRSHIASIQKTGGKMIEREFPKKISDYKVTCMFISNPHEKISCSLVLKDRRGNEINFTFPDASKDTLHITFPYMNENNFERITLLYKHVLTEILWARVLEMKLPKSRNLLSSYEIRSDDRNIIGEITLHKDGRRILSGSKFFSRNSQQ